MALIISGRFTDKARRNGIITRQAPSNQPFEKVDLFQIVTDKLIRMIEENHTLPWTKPWNTVDGYPRNLKTGRFYQGSNIFILSVEALDKGYESPYWVTMNQANYLGGQVKEGEKCTYCLKWRFIPKKDKNTGEEIGGMRPFAYSFRLFNIAQCEGLEVPGTEERDFADVVACEEVGKKMPVPIEIRHGGDKAYYDKTNDRIQLPFKKRFVDVPEYYSTRFHELIHSTGATKRLNRPTLKDAVTFGDQNYSKEELVAEMGAAMLCAATGIENTASIKNSAGYLKGWASKLGEDKRLFTSAATQAQKAADYILGIVREKYDDSEE